MKVKIDRMYGSHWHDFYTSQDPDRLIVSIQSSIMGDDEVLTLTVGDYKRIATDIDRTGLKRLGEQLVLLSLPLRVNLFRKVTL